MTSADNGILIDRDGPIATVSLDRRDSMNALDADLIAALTATFEDLASEPDLRAVVLASTHPKAFVAGADIKAMQKMSVVEMTRFGEAGHRLMQTIERSRLLTAAAVNGYCLGGGFELALSFDLLYAGPNAVFGFPEVGLGLVPGFGGTQRFARSVGMHKALGYIVSGRRFKLDEARELGFLWQIIDHEADFLTRTLEDVSEIIKNAPLAIEAAKRLVRQATHTDYETGSRLEIGSFGLVAGSDDAAEGLEAFLGKRKAEFRGR